MGRHGEAVSDDDDYELVDAGPEPVPRPLRIAGWVWSIYGFGWMLIGAFVVFPQGGVPWGCVWGLLPVLFGWMFTSGGWRAGEGALPGVWLPAVWSIGIGIIHVIAAGYLMFETLNWDVFRGFNPALLVVGVHWFLGVALLIAGGLAIRAVDDYRTWRERWGKAKGREGHPRGP